MCDKSIEYISPPRDPEQAAKEAAAAEYLARLASELPEKLRRISTEELAAADRTGIGEKTYREMLVAMALEAAGQEDG